MRTEPPPDHCVPGQRRAEPGAHGLDVGAHPLQVLGELLRRLVVALGDVLDDLVHLAVVDRDPETLSLLKLQPLLDQFLESLLAMGGHEGRPGALHRLPLKLLGKLLLAPLEDSKDLFARLTLVGLDRLLEDLPQPLVRAVLLDQALEVGLGAFPDVGLNRQQSRTLVNLVGGDRIIIDEHDDRLHGAAPLAGTARVE